MRTLGILFIAGLLSGWLFIAWVVIVHLIKLGYVRDWWIHLTGWLRRFVAPVRRGFNVSGLLLREFIISVSLGVAVITTRALLRIKRWFNDRSDDLGGMLLVVVAIFMLWVSLIFFLP